MEDTAVNDMVSESTIDAPNANEFFGGSYLLNPISQASGVPIDQLNFFVCQLIALLLGFPFRTLLGPHKTSPTIRHVLEILIGLPLAVFCFGSQVKHMFAQSLISLAMMKFIRPAVMPHVVMAYAMGYLCICHIYRMYYDYGGYTLDITGPLMVSTQRLTSLAYNIADGSRLETNPKSKASALVQKLAIRRFPTLLEFNSYIWSFNGMMCGPFCFFSDYQAFIDGTNYLKPGETQMRNGGSKKVSTSPPDPTSSVLTKLFTAVVCLFLSMGVAPYFSCSFILDPQFRTLGYMKRLWYITLSTSLQRYKYYFAWKLAEAVNANSGLGFQYDEKGVANWDLVENADIIQVETSTSLKALLDNWNKMTSQWLRLVVYERSGSTALVFLFSAFWHGFYAGYYLTFLCGGLFTQAARLTRRSIRPWFQTTTLRIQVYAVLTFLVTRFALGYLTFPFVLLEFWSSMEVYRDLYYSMHIVTLLIIVTLTLTSSGTATSSKGKKIE